MSEFKIQNLGKADYGYPIKQTYSLIELDLYRLLCYFAASKSINEISQTYKNELINKFLRIEYEMSEISRVLLNLAIFARNEIDNQKHNESSGFSHLVGELTIESYSKALTFREACNKIIHASFINWDLENVESKVEYDHLNPIVYVYGTHHDKEWKATIRIFEFVSLYVCLIQT